MGDGRVQPVGGGVVAAASSPDRPILTADSVRPVAGPGPGPAAPLQPRASRSVSRALAAGHSSSSIEK